MSKITKYLNQLIVGNVFDHPEVLEAYSTDCSILKITPKLVALPESTEDIRKLLKFFFQLANKNIKFPITVRGAGLSEMGSDLGTGLIISTEKLNRLLEIDTRERLVRVQSGITLKELNTALSVSGLTIPIKANENETIGGLISNHPIDDYAEKYHGIMNYTERMEIVLANGELIQTGLLKPKKLAKKAAANTLEGEIYQTLPKILKSHAPTITKLKPKSTGFSGYATVSFVSQKNSLDILPLFCAAEGSLGIISEIILRTVPLQRKTLRALVSFSKLKTAIDFLELVKPLGPRELNIYDLSILRAAENSGKNLTKITKKLSGGFIVFASFDTKTRQIFKKLTAINRILPTSSKILFDSKENRQTLDEFENSLTNFLNLSKTAEHFPLLTNFFLPSSHLTNFLLDLEELETTSAFDIPFYGSFSNSIYHLRPKFHLKHPDFKKHVLTFLKTGSDLIKKHGGSINGGAPEGRMKALISNHDFSADEKELYKKIKNLFDPLDILNPGIKLETNPRTTLQYFRTTGSGKIVV